MSALMDRITRSALDVRASRHQTPAPEVTGRSAAISFFEEHEQLLRDLAATQDDAAAMKVQLIEHINMVSMLRAANDDLTQQAKDERIRANTWLGYTMKLSGQLQTIKASIDAAQLIATEAAQAAAERGLAERDDPHDQHEVTRVVNQLRPRTELPHVRP